MAEIELVISIDFVASVEKIPALAGITRLVAMVSFNSEKFEDVTQGNIGLLVKDSVMSMHDTKVAQITRERLFAQLRSEGITHLGSVKRLYLEAQGNFR